MNQLTINEINSEVETYKYKIEKRTIEIERYERIREKRKFVRSGMKIKDEFDGFFSARIEKKNIKLGFDRIFGVEYKSILLIELK